MKRFTAVASIALLVLVGMVFAAYKFYCLESRGQISYSLDFGSVLDAAVLLVVGALVEYLYFKQSSDKRADTDLLLKIVEEANSSFKILIEEARPCERGKALTDEERVALTHAERELSNAIHSIEVALSHCGTKPDKLEFGKLKDARVGLKEALTDSPFPGPYDPSAVARIRAASKTIRDELTRIAFEINRSLSGSGTHSPRQRPRRIRPKFRSTYRVTWRVAQPSRTRGF